MEEENTIQEGVVEDTTNPIEEKKEVKEEISSESSEQQTQQN